MTPEASIVEFPPLLDFPAPRLGAYPRETVVAEKLEAVVQLGMSNSRMKDFHDLAVLARNFDSDGDLPARAIRATFERRRTPLPDTLPVALTAAFSEDAAKNTQMVRIRTQGGRRGRAGPWQPPWRRSPRSSKRHSQTPVRTVSRARVGEQAAHGDEPTS